MTNKQASELCANLALRDYEMHKRTIEARDSHARAELVVGLFFVFGVAALVALGVIS